MRFPIFYAFTFLLLVTVQAFGMPTEQEAELYDAYDHYNHAIATDNLADITLYSEKAYTLSQQIYGAEHKSTLEFAQTLVNRL